MTAARTQSASRRYLELRTLLEQEFSDLKRLSQDLCARDSRKYFGLTRHCVKCHTAFDWQRMFGGPRFTWDEGGDFDVSVLSDVEEGVFCQHCGADVGFDFLFRRGVSTEAEARRHLFRTCFDKLKQSGVLDEGEIQRFLRFEFRVVIAEGVLGYPPLERASDEPAIVVTGVERRYQLGATEVMALRGVDLTIRRGEFVALVGTSGSGKSTLLNIIGCIDKPTAGRVQIDGGDTTSLDETARARLRNRKLGFMFQSFNLLPVLNVFENVELPLLARSDIPRSERRDRVAAAINEVGLKSVVKHRPDQLSGGQRQRVAIARALVVQPSLVIADEPTASLDSATAHQIVNVMAEMNEVHGVTFLFSTHDEKLIKRVRRITRIEDGRIVET